MASKQGDIYAVPFSEWYANHTCIGNLAYTSMPAFPDTLMLILAGANYITQRITLYTCIATRIHIAAWASSGLVY